MRHSANFPRLASLLVLAVAATLPVQSATTPFNDLAGIWSGGGQLRLTGGTSEQLTCRAYYTPKAGGADLGMAIRCASSSYKIELRSSLHYEGGSVSGSWEERTFNAGGVLSGKAAGGNINLSFSGPISGSLHVTYGGSSQKVAISTTGSELAGISLNLSR